MLPIHAMLSRCSRERIKRKFDYLSQTTTTRTTILWLQYLNKVTILHRFISKLDGLATVNNTFKQCTICCHICHIWSHTTCNICILIEGSILRLPETHPDAHQNFMESYVLCRIVRTLNYGARAYDKY